MRQKTIRFEAADRGGQIVEEPAKAAIVEIDHAQAVVGAGLAMARYNGARYLREQSATGSAGPDTLP
jgi:hypothetical protein